MCISAGFYRYIRKICSTQASAKLGHTDKYLKVMDYNKLNHGYSCNGHESIRLESPPIVSCLLMINTQRVKGRGVVAGGTWTPTF